MKTFTIAELAQYSLLKVHTIRTWEKRYGLFRARRTASNIRYYSLEDLLYILDFTVLNRSGHKVSALALLDRQTIRQKLKALNNEAAKKQRQVNQLLACMLLFDIEDFELILDSAVSLWGIEQTIEDIVLPFLERLEFFSYAGHTSGEYHFIVTALRKKLILGIEQVSVQEPTTKSALLFLPFGEHFDLLLLYLNYALKKAGLNVLYLGTNVPPCQLQEVVKRKQPHFAVSYVSANDKKNIQKLSLSFAEENGTTFYFIATSKVPKDYTLPLWRVKLMTYKDVPKEVRRLTSL